MLGVKKGKTYVKEGCTACGECVNLCICSAITIEIDTGSGAADKTTDRKKKTCG